MAPKKNPLGLNALQLKTLTLFQELARIEGRPVPDGPEGHVMLNQIPQPHGDHFHLGDAVVLARDASGFANQAAWTALERRGMIKGLFPMAVVITPAGLTYDTGLRDRILHRSHD